MSDLSSKRVRMYDFGLFFSTAQDLAKSFGEVEYYVPWTNAYPSSNLALIGDGFPEVKRIQNFFDGLDSVDLFYFPDLGNGDLQLHLRSLGKRVWGTGKAENLENQRWQTKKLMKKLGMKTSHCERIIGLPALRERLEHEKSVMWVKVSTFRQDWETKRFPGSYRMFKPMLDDLEHRMGAKADVMEFILEDDIPDAVETGYDGWSIDGKFPDLGMLGLEIKGSGLIGKVMPYEKLPDDVRETNEQLSGELKRLGCRGNVSSELRNGVLIDPCMRQPSPPSELYPSMYENYAEAVWHGADGELVPMKMKWEYGCEIVIESDWADANWTALYYPQEIADFVKLRNCAMFNGQPHALPMKGGPRVGAVIGLGNTLLGAVSKALEHAGMVEGHQIEADVESVSKGLKEIEKLQENGIQFTDETIPTPDELDALISK